MMPLRCRFDRFSLASGHDPIVVSVPLSVPLWVPLRCLFDRFIASVLPSAMIRLSAVWLSHGGAQPYQS